MSNLYGTMWLIEGDRNEISDRDTCMLEIIAGRIGCELERTGLARKLKQQSDSIRAESQDDTTPAPNADSNLNTEKIEEQSALIQPPFHGWQIESATNNGSSTACFQQRWTGYRVTAAETMMVLSIHVGAEGAKRKISSIRSAFDAFCSLSVSPAKLIDGAFRIIQQGFERFDDVSICCIEIDPLTGEYRWVSRGSDWGSLVNPLTHESELTRDSGAACLPRQSELKLSLPDNKNIWRPALIIRRSS